jgi:hypothetical protein
MGTEIEKPDVETGSSSDGPRNTAIDRERAQLLADLPDPDLGKSDEEKAAIVRTPRACAVLELQGILTDL